MARRNWFSLEPFTTAEHVELWRVVARHREANGDAEGAAQARWQARSIRSAYPVPRKAAP